MYADPNPDVSEEAATYAAQQAAEEAALAAQEVHIAGAACSFGSSLGSSGVSFTSVAEGFDYPSVGVPTSASCKPEHAATAAAAGKATGPALPPPLAPLRLDARGASRLGRWLLAVRNRTLAGLLSAFFCVHAWRTGQVQAAWLWCQSLSNAASDDPTWPLLTLMAVVASAFRIWGQAAKHGWAFLLALVAIVVGHMDMDVIVGGTLWVVLLFYLAAAAIISFWTFVFRLWAGCYHRLLSGALTKWDLEDRLAFAVMLWWLARTTYVAAALRLEKRFARSLLEKAFRRALKHPFRAELEQGFGRRLPGLRSGRLRLRNFGFKGVTKGLSALFEADKMETLPGKQDALIATRRLEAQQAAAGDDVLPSVLVLQVRRSHLLEDSFRALLESPTCELLAPEMSVEFEGEEGVDCGGLTRDWFDAVGQALLEGVGDVRGSSLLTLAPDQTLMPRPVSHGGDCEEVAEADEESYRSLLALGRFLALAILHWQALPLSFSLVFCKHFLRLPIGMDDVRSLDPGFYRARVERILEEGGLAYTVRALGEPLTFVSAPTDLRPLPEDLKPGGASEVVTEGNLTEYVQLLCEAYLCGSIRREMQCVLLGFWDLLPFDDLQRCGVGARDLSVLISGQGRLDPHDWRVNSVETGDDAVVYPQHGGGNSQVRVWFWQLLKDLTDEQRSMLLHFTTGSSRLPPGGFAALSPPFSVTVNRSGTPGHLPHAHTCANQIVLPPYKSKDQLRVKLLLAISSKDFGFA